MEEDLLQGAIDIQKEQKTTLSVEIEEKSSAPQNVELEKEAVDKAEPDSEASDKVLSDAEAEDKVVSDDKPKDKAAPESEAQDKKDSGKIILEEFISQLENEKDADKKLEFAIDSMRKTLSFRGGPCFREFWDVRRLCLPLFGENVADQSKYGESWQEFNRLTREAHSLKEIVDEQSAFAAEQIELAIKGLEEEIRKLDETIKSNEDGKSPFTSKVIERKHDFYRAVQCELSLLNACAGRINSLRKELIKTDMRIRLKNRLFQRLSVAGDSIFPRRKDMIKMISDQFIEDVEAFISQNFSDESIQGSIYTLREEIKELQTIAKVLTLNTHAFTHTRMKLSKCWDIIKELEKERKKERVKQRALYKDNVDAVEDKINAVVEAYGAGELSREHADKEFGEILKFMRTVDLVFDQVKMLKDKIYNARKPIADEINAEERERKAKIEEKQRLKKEQVQNIKDKIKDLMENVESRSLDDILNERDFILKEMETASMMKSEQVQLERMLHPLKGAIVEKKEQALLALSDDDRQVLDQFRSILQQRKDMGKEVKKQLEMYRKSQASSGLDFEKSMMYNELINEEKDRLQKVYDSIKDTEQKIAELEGKVDKK